MKQKTSSKKGPRDLKKKTRVIQARLNLLEMRFRGIQQETPVTSQGQSIFLLNTRADPGKGSIDHPGE